MCSSMLDQHFFPIPSAHEISFCLTTKRYANLQENMRLPYQIC